MFSVQPIPPTTTATTTAAPELPLQLAITSWEKLNLKQLLKDLDTKGLEIVSNQKETQQSRKKLTDDTKDFRKLATDPERLLEFPRILKLYQVEIDALTKRLKTAENYFLEVYSVFVDGFVDPLPFLLEFLECAQLKASHGALDLENSQLRLELAKLNSEVAQLNTVTVLNTRLQDRIKLLEKQLQIAESKSAAVAPSGSVESGDLVEKVEFLKQRESDLTKQLQLTEAKLKAASTLAVTQKSASFNEQANRSELVGYVTQINQLEQEVQEYRLKAAQWEREFKSIQSAEIYRNNLDSENGTQMADLLRLVEDSKRERHGLELKLEDLKRQRQEDSVQHEAQVLELGKQISSLEVIGRKFNELKTELDALKSLDFSEEELQNDTLSLEALSVLKNRKLQAQLSELRTQYEFLQHNYEALCEKSALMETRLKQQDELIKRLEADLFQFRHQKSETPPAPFITESSSPVADTKSNSLLQIITSQRDRYHQRNTQLEDENRQLQSKFLDANTQHASLKEDNLRLYEKIRYLSTFQQQDSKQIRVRIDDDDDIRRKNVSSDETLSKYDSIYEQKLDPFAQFNSKEQKRKIQHMSPQDRATLHLSKILLSNKYSRLFFLGYTILLHTLVFGMLFWVAGVDQKHETSDELLMLKLRSQNKDYSKSIGLTIKTAWGSDVFCQQFCPTSDAAAALETSKKEG